MRPLIALVLAAVLSGAAIASEPIVVRGGDRVLASIPADGFVALLLDGLEGTKLTVKARGRTSGFEPEAVVLDPAEREVRRAHGASRAKIRELDLPETGGYLLIVRALDRREGLVEVKLRADHPRKIRAEGTVSARDEVDAVRFPAFAGTVARIKVKGRSGFVPAVDSVRTPGASTIPLSGGFLTDEVFRHEAFSCDAFGDHRLLIGGLDGAVGRWKARVKLTHPAPERRDLEIEGITEEEGTRQGIPVPVPPEEPEDNGPWPLQNVVATSTFRVTLEFADPPPDPNQPSVRTLSQTLRIRIRLDNLSASSQAITWFQAPWAWVGLWHVENDRYYGSIHVLGDTRTVTYPPGPVLDWTQEWSPDLFDYYGFPPGKVEARAMFATTDPRVPQTATLRLWLR